MLPDDTSSMYWAMGGGGITWLAQMLWGKIFSKEGRAYDQLIQQMSDELKSIRDRMSTMEAGLDEERKLRRIAEDKVHLLQLDNLQLRATLKAHGIDTPPALVDITATADDYGNKQQN
jgi:hypothetical protein